MIRVHRQEGERTRNKGQIWESGHLAQRWGEERMERRVRCWRKEGRDEDSFSEGADFHSASVLDASACCVARLQGREEPSKDPL